MLAVLKNRTYRHLFAAQVIALVGTGLMTVALGLLAYELAGADAGAVLGTALAIKMLAYVGIAPIAQAFADRLPRRSLLVALDLIRAAVALCLPFVTEVWQIYLLIFVLQAASAGFTPTFQATIPDILPDEEIPGLAFLSLAVALWFLVRERGLPTIPVSGEIRGAVEVLASYVPSRSVTVRVSRVMFHWRS